MMGMIQIVSKLPGVASQEMGSSGQEANFWLPADAQVESTVILGPTTSNHDLHPGPRQPPPSGHSRTSLDEKFVVLYGVIIMSRC